MFSVPTAVYWASHRYDGPFLTVILNNSGWNATRQCLADVHPQGMAAGLTNRDLGVSLVEDGRIMARLQKPQQRETCGRGE